jgi:hypothetical protein
MSLKNIHEKCPKTYKVFYIFYFPLHQDLAHLNTKNYFWGTFALEDAQLVCFGLDMLIFNVFPIVQLLHLPKRWKRILVFVCLLPKAFPFLHFDEIDILISSK